MKHPEFEVEVEEHFYWNLHEIHPDEISPYVREHRANKITRNNRGDGTIITIHGPLVVAVRFGSKKAANLANKVLLMVVHRLNSTSTSDEGVMFKTDAGTIHEVALISKHQGLVRIPSHLATCFVPLINNRPVKNSSVNIKRWLYPRFDASDLTKLSWEPIMDVLQLPKTAKISEIEARLCWPEGPWEVEPQLFAAHNRDLTFSRNRDNTLSRGRRNSRTPDTRESSTQLSSSSNNKGKRRDASPKRTKIHKKC